MEQNQMLIQLLDYLQDSYPYGNDEGRRIFSQMQDLIAKHPDEKIFGISLKGVQVTDASFPRESIVSLAKMYKGEKGFYLCDFASQDLLDNWSYAAQAKVQPIIIKKGKGYELIGPPVTDTSKALLDIVMKEGTVTTSVIAEELNVSPQNASAKMKKLLDLGLVLASKEAAESGGLEFVFTAIK
ncbi:MAG: helix-turn-helix domain-containing protein [Pseudomonadota bacterium]